MYGHWFTRSQFTLIPEKHYATLQAKFTGLFQRPWRSLKAEWDKVKGGPTSEIQGARSFFDNTHDVMRDVWEFSRVHGDERHGHATPKPVDMMKRVMLSSLPKDGLCLEPFGGSGSTLMGAQLTNRRCFTVELKPEYCDVIVKRWESFTEKPQSWPLTKIDGQEIHQDRSRYAVNRVARLLANGAVRSEIVQYCAKEWELAERQADTYIAKAELIRADWETIA